MTGKTLTWWHCSDLHWNAHPKSERLYFAENLLRALQEQILERHAAPDFVAFTGDIANSGQAVEYESAAQAFFDPLRRILEPVGNPPLLLAPGNHDLDREYAASLNASRITDIATQNQVDEFLEDTKARDLYLTPFANYKRFAESYAPDCSNPLAWSFPLAVEGPDVELHGINSAWSGGYRVEAGTASDKGGLLLGLNQLSNAHLSEGKLRILLMHHPIDWIDADICSQIEQHLRAAFDIVLTGHIHTPRNLRLIADPESRCLFVPCPVLYDRPDSDSLQFARGLSVGEYFPDTATCRVHIYRYSDVKSPKLLPYSEVYRAGEEFFEARLSQPSAKRNGASPSASTFISAASSGLLAERLDDLTGDSISRNAHALRVFREVLEVQEQIDSLPILGSAQAASVAFYLASLTVQKDALAVHSQGEMSSASRDAALADLDELEPHLAELAVEDLSILRQLIPMLTLAEPVSFGAFGNLSKCPTALLFLVLWGLARYASLMDKPALIPGGDAPASRYDGVSDNVLDVRLNPTRSEVELRVATTTRSEFHRIAEAKHALDIYLAQVEQVWRESGISLPAIRIKVTFPLWTERSLESHFISVDPGPITKLLMGKALYGGREHIWLRELIQNAVDATEMRKQLFSEQTEYAPSITVEQRSDRLVEIRDNGVGMALSHVLTYLVTLGRSGWRALDAAQNGRDASSEASLFGRFGIGFASVFGSASRVRLWTRQPHTRSVDGMSVMFTSPDRPFFIEPAICDAGTRIEIELAEPLTEANFKKHFEESFVYLPKSVVVVPSIEIPSSLEAASTFHAGQGKQEMWQTISDTVDAKIGSVRARINTQLILPVKSRESRKADSSEGAQPSTRLTLAVDGVLISSKSDLRFKRQSGRPSFYQESEAKLGLRGCHVIVDFERDTAPVLASRNDLQIAKEIDSEFKGILKGQIVSLIPRLMELAPIAEGSGQRRNAAVMEAIESITTSPTPTSWGGTGLNDDPVVKRAFASFYREQCPVGVRRAGRAEWLLLDDVDAATCFTAVLEVLAEHPLFAIYARSRGLESWIVASSQREMDVLTDAWEYERALITVEDTQGLFMPDLMPEVRDNPLVSLLRGDYALSDSPLFQDALFVQLPGGGVPRHVGASSRRSDVSERLRARVFINSQHRLVEVLGNCLASCSDAQRQQISQWLETFCDGVIEDKSKLAPVARWRRLRHELGEIAGVDVSSLDAKRLEL